MSKVWVQGLQLSREILDVHAQLVEGDASGKLQLLSYQQVALYNTYTSKVLQSKELIKTWINYDSTYDHRFEIPLDMFFLLQGSVYAANSIGIYWGIYTQKEISSDLMHK